MAPINPKPKYIEVNNGEISKIKKVSFNADKSSEKYDENVFKLAKEFLAEISPYVDGAESGEKDKRISLDEIAISLDKVKCNTKFEKFIKDKLGPIGQKFLFATDFAYDKSGNIIDGKGDGFIDEKELAAAIKWFDSDKDGNLGSGLSIGSKFVFKSPDKYRKELLDIHKNSDFE